MSVTESLEREVQGCDVRLTFLQRDDTRSTALRREVEQRRADTVRDLALIESEHLPEEIRLPQ